MAVATKRKLTSIENSSPVKALKLITTSFGVSFRKRLKTENAINVLKEFVETNEERDVVTEYIDAGGSAKELLGLMKQYDGKQNPVVANTVLSALHYIISKCNSDLLLIQKDVEEACEQLLCDYQVILQNMLSNKTSTNSHRMVVLQLFTGMVNLSNGLARRLLTMFPISIKTIKLLTDVRMKLRTNFIHYLLSFLVDDNVVLISELLQKRYLNHIITGLISDEPETIVLVLNTLRLKIVENIRISKTLKLHTFNTPVLRSLEKLYDYSISSDELPEDRELIVSVEQTVKEAVHSLLITLCTSHKKGILFKERSLVAGKSPNQLIFTLLESIQTPWENNLRSELVTEILKVCPEFMKTIYHSMDQYIQPSVSDKWINLMNFIKEIVKKQEFAPENIDEQQTMSFIATHIFPAPLQKLLRELSDENIHSHAVIRFHTMSLLHCVLSKVKQILNYCIEHCQQKGNLVSLLEIQIDNFLNKNLIPSLYIFNAYKSAITIKSEEPEPETSLTPDLNEYSILAADLLLLYSQLSPLNFNQLRVHESLDLTCESDDDQLSFKIAQLMFQIHNPKPGQDQFAFMMKHFLRCYTTDADFHRNDVIQNVLLSTGFFDGFEEEIIIWLNCIRNAPATSSAVISDLITNTLCTLGKKLKKFMTDLTTVSSYEDPKSGPDASLFIEEYGDLLDFGDEFESVGSLPVKLSPMVPAFLFTLKTLKLKNDDAQAVREFVTSVLFHLLHAQCTYYGLAALIEKYSNSLINDDFPKYLNFWNLDVDPLDLATIPDISTQYLYRILVLRDCPVEQLSSFISNATELDCILLWNTCLFYTIQLHNKDMLPSETISDIISILHTIAAKLQTQSTLCLKLILTNHRFVNSFTVERGKSNAFTEILIKTVLYFLRHEVALKYCSRFLSSYRLKFMLSILEKLRTAKRIKINCEAYTVQDIMKFLTLTGKHVVELLNKLLRLPTNLLINEKQTKLSEWSVLLRCLLDEAAKNLDDPLTDEDFNTLIAKMIEILKSGVSTDHLEDGMISYLSAFPHQIRQILDDDVENLLIHHPRVNKLAVFLIQYHPSHLDTLQSKLLPVKDLLDDVNFLFDVLNKIQSVGEIQERVLSQVYKSRICDLTQLLETQCSWLTANRNLIVKIIQQFADKKKCSKFCQNLESKWLEIELDVDKYHILRVLFEKADKVDSLIQLSLTKLNHLLANGEDAIWLCELTMEIVTSTDIKFLLGLDIWKEFVKLSLKFGLQSANPILLRTLRTFCARLFQDNHSPEDSSIIFQMTISHSEFITIMLSDSSAKYDLVELLITLTAINTSLMSSNHVPLLISSYKATLSKCDQAIFQLLRWYEDNGIRFSDCRPYLWGDAAVTHHSIRTEISVSLKRQPLPNQVLDLFDSEIIKNTIRYFPLDRSLKPANQYIEYEHKMYDTSFILPLLSHLLAPESRISIQKFTRSGALSIILCALSSQATDLRMAAYHCLQRFRAHLFSREKEIHLWEHFVNALQKGISANLSDDQDDTAPRLPCIVTTFLAQMSLIIGEPLHPLYVLLTNFLLAKPIFDINTVPNFLMLFYSTDERNKDHQEWILNVIKYGMRYKSDWIVSQKCFLFKLLLQYSFSSISNESTNALTLDILAAGLRIPECRQSIVTKYGFLSWMAQVISSITAKHKALVPSIIEILELLISVKNSLKITYLALQLLYKLSDLRIGDDTLEKLLSVLAHAYGSCKIKNIIDRDTIELIITISAPLLSLESVKKYRNCLKYKSASVINPSVAKADQHLIHILKNHLQDQQ